MLSGNDHSKSRGARCRIVPPGYLDEGWCIPHFASGSARRTVRGVLGCCSLDCGNKLDRSVQYLCKERRPVWWNT